MPQLGNVVLTDRATTPVAHTFTPRGKEGVAGGRFVKAGVSAIADMVLVVDTRKTPGGRFKMTLSLTQPVVQTKVENGVTSYVVSRANRSQVTFDFASDSTEQERKDIVGMTYSGLGASQTLVDAVLTKLESIW